MRILIGVVVLIAIGLGLYFWLWPSDSSEVEHSDTTMQTYRNDVYGYTFEYPKTYAVKEYRPESVAVGMAGTTTDSFDGAMEISIARSEDSGTTTPYATYEDFLSDRTRAICAGSGPSGSVKCTDILDPQIFSTPRGISGVAFFLQEEKIDTANATTTVGRKGPFFAFNTSVVATSSPFSALIVHPPMSVAADQVNTAVLTSIMQSLMIDRVNNLDIERSAQQQRQ